MFIEYNVHKKILEYCQINARKLKNENFGERTLSGSDDRDLKGMIAQIIVHQKLKDMRISHEFGKPYVKNQYGDNFDIKCGSEIWDVKCRSTWEQAQKYGVDNFNMYMTQQEFDERYEKKCDYYIFTTINKDYSTIYILGAISFIDLWNNLIPTRKDWSYKIPTAGIVRVPMLKPFNRFVYRV